MIFLKQYKDGSANEQLDQGERERERRTGLQCRSSLTNDFSLSIQLVLQQYQDHSKITSKQFYDLMVNLHQAFNEVLGGTEKFDELLKFVENQQPQV